MKVGILRLESVHRYHCRGVLHRTVLHAAADRPANKHRPIFTIRHLAHTLADEHHFAQVKYSVCLHRGRRVEDDLLWWYAWEK
jgi:hypothetical protein